MTITIKRCILEDLIPLQQISIETYKETFEAYNTVENMHLYLNDAYNSEKLTAELINTDSEFYFIYDHHQLAGYLKINTGKAQTETISKSSLEIERIYVRSAFKRHGLGHHLIAKAIQLAKEKRKATIWLGVWEHNESAKLFYYKMGFTQTGSHSFFMGKDEQTDYILTKKIT
ncbi:GNAT family N-acetyltransferase [Vagococcus sp. BWB3-3]|uniref:GNAT family N-acetyltransferase n=1 Tax=Vagococcus allomyrinae TaxID=2794353 RepID=A0A940SVF9_9ENTE|nr:N-acetyltransferase [Vagococcus allomyrinae]MBP1041804.1 GNAT family N-acetyltransferase [Vagococcus allomyrinae]